MLIDLLHQKFDTLQDLRIREIRVDKRQRRVFCTLSYPAAPQLNNTVKADLTDFVRRQMPSGYYCSVRFADDNFTAASFTRNLIELIKDRYPIFSNIGREQINVSVIGKSIAVTLSVNAVTKKNLESVEFCQKLSEYYAEYTSFSVEFVLREDDAVQNMANVGEQEKLVQLAINKELLKPSRHFQIDNQRVLFGKTIPTMPMYISDLRSDMDNCTVCGIVSSKDCKQAKNNPLLQVCSFVLTDGTGSSLRCVLFVRMQITDVETIMNETGKGEAEAKTISEKRVLANDKRMKNILWLADGMSIAVHGKVVHGLSGQLEMHAYDVCVCNIQPLSSHAEFSREVAKEYLLVKPEECFEYRQINFAEQHSESSLLSDKEYVVLHVNGSDFGNVIEDKLFAICAVKLHGGHLTEKIFTYINPEKVIDDKALEPCRLAADNLIFYPTLTEIISDLYKFLHGAVLVGNNIEHIVALLNYYAAPMNYKFENETAVQTDLLSALFDNSTLDVKVNIAKLDDVAKKCKVECPSTVFCRDSALTVARCMSMLCYNSK